MRNFKSPKIWIGELVRWFVRGMITVLPYLFWMGALSFIWFYRGSLFDCKEVDIRILGMGFQVLGLGFLAFQLANLYDLFRLPGWMPRLKKYATSFPSPFVRIHNVRMEAVSGRPTVSFSVGVKSTPDTSLGSRVKDLESELSRVKGMLNDTTDLLEKYRKEGEAWREQFAFESRQEFQNLNTQLHDAVVGNMHIEWIVLIYLLTGVVLATASPELADLIGYSGQCG